MDTLEMTQQLLSSLCLVLYNVVGWIVFIFSEILILVFYFESQFQGTKNNHNIFDHSM